MKNLKHIETEERMIAALLYDYKTTIDKANTMNEDLFTVNLHKEILRACTALAEEGQEIEPISISQVSGGFIKVYELVKFSFDYMDTTNFVIGDYKELERLRQLREIHSQLHQQLSNVQSSSVPAEITTDINENLLSIIGSVPQSNSTLQYQSDRWADELSDRFDGKKAPGIPTGYQELDLMTGGLIAGNLVVIGARPGVGKTTFAMNLAWNVVARQIPVAFISLEMMSNELVEKLVSREGMIDGADLKLANMPNVVFETALHAKGLIEKQPLYIIDDVKNDLSSILHRAGQLVHTDKVKVVIVDYLQLMSAGKSSENRNTELSKITRAFKQFAQRENVVVILLSQVNRQAAARAPKIYDLRDSGAIEQDANIVYLLHDYDDKSSDILGVSIAKNRAGRTGIVKLTFLNKFSLIKGSPED